MHKTAILIILFLLLSTVAAAPEKNIDCNELATMRERIACNINHPELSILNIPEICRNIGGTEGEQCVTRHQRYLKCYALPNYAAQLACGRKILNWKTNTVREEARLCATTDNPQLCMQELEEK